MGAIYFIEIDGFSEQDAKLAKQFNEEDRVVFLPNETGQIDYMLIPSILSWKVEPFFYPPVNDERNNLALLFMIAMQCDEQTETVNIISKEEEFLTLDGYIIGTKNGELEIHVSDSLSELFRNISDGGQKTEAAEKEPSVSYKYYGKNPDSDYRQAPDAFINRLKEIEQEKKYPLTPYANALYESLMESTDGVIATLEFQLQMRIKDDHVAEFLDVLQEYTEELCELVNFG